MAGYAEHGGLHNLIQRIRSSFKSLVTVGRGSAGLSDFDAVAAGLHNENQRFDLWCRNLGAYQSGHASLEYRLRDAPKVYDYALRLLTDLDCTLTLALEEARGKQDAHHSDSDVIPEGEPSLDDVSEDESDDDEFLASYNAKPLADILIKSISAAIDRLYRLSFKVRNPATRFDLSRFLKFEDIDSETGTDILTYYAQFDQNHIKELLRDLRAPKPATQKRFTQNGEIPAEATAHSEARVGNEDSHSTSIPQTRHDELDSEFLVQRLAHANNIRRRQFRYWQTHQKKLAAIKAEPLLADVVRLAGNETGPTWMPTPSLATTEATKLREEDIELSDNRSVVSSATYALMQKEPGHGKVRVPPFPKWLEDKKEFECPYCCIVCPGSMARKSGWETHVLRDLRPYVCTFEDCRQADQLFDTFQSWRLHEIQAHGAELAEPLYGEIHESAGPQGQGRAPEDKVDRQLPTGTAGDTRTCPLCLLPGVTAAHVGAHLQRMAIFALPLIQHSGKTDSAEDEDSNEALGSAHASSTTTTSYSGRDSDQPLAQGSSISQDGGETSHLRLDDLIAQEEVAKQDIMSRYLDAEEPRRSEESASMSRTPRRDDFVPLPPRIPIHHQGPDPIIEVLPPNPRRTPEVHQGPRRNSFDFPINHSPVRAYEPELAIERERDRRRKVDRLARHEARRRREAEEEAERVRLAAVKERERRRRAQEMTQQMERMAINERERRGEAEEEEEARRLAAEAADAEARVRQAEAALLLERRLAEREREGAVRERQRQAEIEDRADADAWNDRRRPDHIFQQDLPPLVDRGAEVLRQAQEAERRRRESDALYRMERNRYRDGPRRQRSLTLFEDDDGRRLVFREGDQIEVLKKAENTDGW